MPRYSRYARAPVRMARKANQTLQSDSLVGNFVKGYRKRYNVYKPAAEQLISDVKRLKSLINVELKAAETASTSATVTDTATIVNLSLVAQGDDYNNRQGRSLKAHDLQINATASGHPSSTITVLRCIIFKTNQNQSAAPAVGDILKDASDVHSQYEMSDNQRSFVILSDRKFLLVTGADSQLQNLNYKKSLSHHIMYSGTAATEASTGSGAVYMLLLSDRSTNSPTVEYSARMRFIDN